MSTNVEAKITVETAVPAPKDRKPRKATNPKLTPHDVSLRVERMLAAKEKAKSLYAECDRIEAELIAAIGSTVVTLSDGRTVRVNNNFIDKNGKPKNVAYKVCGVKLLEVVVK